MSETFPLVRRLVAAREVRISEHGYDQLAEDGISASEVLDGVDGGTVVEDYPDYPKGPSVLVLQMDSAGQTLSCGLGHPERLPEPTSASNGIQTRPKPMGRAISGETKVTLRRKTKYIHEGQFVAEVEVDIIEDDTSWSPYLSVVDAKRLDQVRAALRNGDLKAAARVGRVYRLEPVATT
ncbi:MAG: DUF4258 domain-containing protein [Burkholderiales bacterium]